MGKNVKNHRMFPFSLFSSTVVMIYLYKKITVTMFQQKGGKIGHFTIN
jgi:hypothetical protein